jgi:hypothetical protein
LIGLAPGGIAFAESRAAIERARKAFAREHCVMIPRFLSTDLLRLLQLDVARGEFRRQIHARLGGSDLSLPHNNAAGALLFIMNDSRLFAALEEVTGCGRLRAVTGSIRRAVAGKGKVLSWHDDNLKNRRVAITINLSPKKYRGGLLQIRDRRTQQIVREIANVGPGDAVLFRVSPNLEHRNTEVIGETPKTAFSGWFHSRPIAARAHPGREDSRAPRRQPKSSPVMAASRVVISPDTLIKQADGATMLLNVRTGSVCRLNATGAEMLALLKRRVTPRQIAAVIAAQYDAAREAVERDCLELFNELATRDLIKLTR